MGWMCMSYLHPKQEQGFGSDGDTWLLHGVSQRRVQGCETEQTHTPTSYKIVAASAKWALMQLDRSLLLGNLVLQGNLRVPGPIRGGFLE